MASDLHERLVDEVRQQVEHVDLVIALVGADGGRCSEVEGPCEHREPVERVAFGLFEELIGPLDGRLERLVAAFGLPSVAQEPEPVVESFGQLRERHRPHSCGCELEREGDAVELFADVNDVLHIVL